MEKLFSYGTLQQENVQTATFGRKLKGAKDTLEGYRLEDLEITDPHVIKVSGKAIHQILVPSENPQDCIKGTVFDLTPDEIKQADSYEVSDYVRVTVTLASKTQAFVYAHKSTLKGS